MRAKKRKKRVLVAMSGGVDSSLAAHLLKNQGFDTIGATMKLWPKEHCGKYYRAKACCSLEGIDDARHVAGRLGIPHYVFDFHKKFKKGVIDYFCAEYARGRTPNPCIVCNQKIKFGIFLDKAEELGCHYIATGHYAKVGYKRLTERYFVKEGGDKKKDQSYFLSFVSQRGLSRSIFPLGDITKAEARGLARKAKLKVHDKISSQEVCFVPGHYSEYIKGLGARTPGEGDIVNMKGEKIGRHKGIQFYTVGQRKGLGIAYEKPLYVAAINRKTNTITAGLKKDVMGRVMIVKEQSWGAVNGISGPIRAFVKIRYGHPGAAALVEKIGDKRLKVTFRVPQEAPTPGQATVFYKNGMVLGGGWIDSVIK